MTHQEIKELAGHRAVSPWVMKLVGDAVAKEREQCAMTVDKYIKETSSMEARGCLASVAYDIRARNNK